MNAERLVYIIKNSPEDDLDSPDETQNEVETPYIPECVSEVQMQDDTFTKKREQNKDGLVQNIVESIQIAGTHQLRMSIFSEFNALDGLNVSKFNDPVTKQQSNLSKQQSNISRQFSKDLFIKQISNSNYPKKPKIKDVILINNQPILETQLKEDNFDEYTNFDWKGLKFKDARKKS